MSEVTENNNKAEPGAKIRSLWKRLENWVSDDNLVPIIFSANCCNSMLDLLSDDNFKNLVDLYGANDQNHRPDLLIIHGHVNEKKLELIKRAYSNLIGKKYVLGIGSCLLETNGGYYNAIKNIREEIPFDIIVPGCSANSENIIKAIKQLPKIR